MKINTFIKNEKEQIYLNNESIGDFAKMLNIIINSPETKYKFKNFSKIELKVAKLIIKEYKEYLVNQYQKEQLTIVTHCLKFKDRKHFILNRKNIESLEYKILYYFQTIDNVELKSVANSDIMIIEGIVCLYGIYNEYGFYNIDKDEFIHSDELETNPNIVITTLEEQNKLHYVRKRVR